MAESIDSGDVCTVADKIFEEGIQKPEVLKLYGIWAKDYEHDLIVTNYQGWKNTADAVAEALGEQTHARVLDMACGTGKVGEELTKLGFSNVDGLDPNPVMTEYAKQKGVYKKFIQAWMGTNRIDEIPDGYYDAACVNAAMGSGHLNASCFGEMLRIVRKGGFIVIQLYEMRLVNAEMKDVRESIERRIQAGDWKVVNKVIKFAHEEYEGEPRIGEYNTFQVL